MLSCSTDEGTSQVHLNAVREGSQTVTHLLVTGTPSLSLFSALSSLSCPPDEEANMVGDGDTEGRSDVVNALPTLQRSEHVGVGTAAIMGQEHRDPSSAIHTGLLPGEPLPRTRNRGLMTQRAEGWWEATDGKL